MTAFVPFQANSSLTVGKTVTLATGATNTSASTVASITSYAPTLLVVNFGPNFAWVRFSAEATPTAAGTDIPMLGNTSRLFVNPVPLGNLGIAVIVSVTTSANVLYVCPGQGAV